AQRTYESQATDIFKFFRIPPKNLSWGNKRDRRRILKYVYAGSPWVNIDSIEAEALELNETDPAQAERFFGNRLVYGQGSWLRDGLWEGQYAAALAAQS
ncbi:terminase, partial [Rhodococcus hoagii]|nr:terminase [Prescottella equi]